MNYLIQSMCLTIIFSSTSESPSKSKSKSSPDIEEFIDRLLVSDKFERIAEKIAEKAADKIVNLQSIQRNSKNVDEPEAEDAEEGKYIRGAVSEEVDVKLIDSKNPTDNPTYTTEPVKTKSIKHKKKSSKKHKEHHSIEEDDKRGKKKTINSLSVIAKLAEQSPVKLSLNYQHFGNKTDSKRVTDYKSVWDYNGRSSEQKYANNTTADDEQDAEGQKSANKPLGVTKRSKPSPTTLKSDEESELSSESTTTATERSKKTKRSKRKQTESTVGEAKPARKKKKDDQRKRKNKNYLKTTTSRNTGNVTSDYSSEASTSSSEEKESATTTTITTTTVESTTETIQTTIYEGNQRAETIKESGSSSETVEHPLAKKSLRSRKDSQASSSSSDERAKEVPDKSVSIADSERVDDRKTNDSEESSSDIEKVKTNATETNVTEIDDKIDNLDLKHLVRKQNGKLYAFAQDTDYEEYHEKLREILKTVHNSKNPDKKSKINQDLLDMLQG